MKITMFKLKNEASNKNYTITSINSIKVLFQMNGLKLEATNYLKTLICRFIFVFNFLWLNVVAVGELIWFCDGVWWNDQFVNLASVVPCIMLCILGNIKMILHNLNETIVAELINNFKGLEDDEFNDDIDTDIRSKEKIYDEEIKYLNKILRIVKTLNVITIIAFGLTPFLMMGLNYLKTNELVWILPFYVKYYFFDPYQYYCLVCFHQFWGMCVCLSGLASVDMLFCTMCAFIKINFKLLQYDFERFIPGQTVWGGSLKGNQTIQRKLNKLVKKHQKVISCANLLDRHHSNEFMVNFFISSFLICLAAFIISVVEDMRFRISFLVFLITCLQQLFLLCFFGDMVMTCSVDLSESIYKSSWYWAKPNIRGQLSYILYRSQKPCKITASGFVDVNLVIFTKIISKTWSLFALLKTIFNP